MKLGLIQYAITQNPSTNLARVAHLLDRAAKRRPDYLILPEMWLGGPRTKSERPAWNVFYAGALKNLRTWCRKKGIGCFFSQVEEGKKGIFYNTAYFIEKNGRIGGRYRKIHLFSLDGESRMVRAGRGAKPFKSGNRKIGCVICYDIRFPELPRLLARLGASILIVCAQWPEVRIEHWMTLLKARAIENQFFVAATNRLGVKGKNSYGGHSVVFDPWGKCLLHLPRTKEVGFVDIDLAKVNRIRKTYPFFSDCAISPIK
ncbi:MAG: hypothetical protein HY541_00330 [Deltaproteobacteria bacterium]|nr:hypothetical protein [Deltaproteobacteria bacterium]